MTKQKPLADEAPQLQPAPALIIVGSDEGALCSDGICEVPRH